MAPYWFPIPNPKHTDDKLFSSTGKQNQNDNQADRKHGSVEALDAFQRAAISGRGSPNPALIVVAQRHDCVTSTHWRFFNPCVIRERSCLVTDSGSIHPQDSGAHPKQLAFKAGFHHNIVPCQTPDV